MTVLIVDTEPVKGYVTIRYVSADGAIVAQGEAPVRADYPVQWIAWVQFGDVEGYVKPPDDRVPVKSDNEVTYTYTEGPTPAPLKLPLIALGALIGGTTGYASTKRADVAIVGGFAGAFIAYLLDCPGEDQATQAGDFLL